MSIKEPTDEELDALSCSARILGLHRASLRSIRHFGRRVWLECVRAHAADKADAERFRWLINDKNWDETNDTPMVTTSEDVHWGDKARALIDRHMQKD